MRQHCRVHTKHLDPKAGSSHLLSPHPRFATSPHARHRRRTGPTDARGANRRPRSCKHHQSGHDRVDASVTRVTAPGVARPRTPLIRHLLCLRQKPLGRDADFPAERGQLASGGDCS